MIEAFVSVGSNIQPADNVRRAIDLLAEQARITGVSTVWRTEPIGRPDQPRYFNCVVRVETDRSPESLAAEVLKAIEQRLGRQRSADRYAARPIDLDVVAYRDGAAGAALVVLDPEVPRRAFLAAGLAELSPGLPPSDSPREGIEPLWDYTAALRERHPAPPRANA